MGNILKREISKQFLRFCLVGLESAFLNFLVFIILFYFLFISYTLAFIAGFISGALLGFVFNKLWSFESKREHYKEVFIYILVYLISLIIGTTLIKFLVDSTGLSPILASIPILALTTLINFFGVKIFSFRNKKW